MQITIFTELRRQKTQLFWTVARKQGREHPTILFKEKTQKAESVTSFRLETVFVVIYHAKF